MNFSSLKKIICFLLAVLMLFSAVGCKQETKKKKKKVIIKKKVVVKKEDENDNNQSNIQIVNPEDTNTQTKPDEEEQKGLPERPLPEVSEEVGYVEWVEPIVPEFEYDYASLNITSDYVIVYGLEKWENRLESRNRDGSDRYITSTGYTRLAANDLKAYFKDKLNLNLKVEQDIKVKEAEEATGTTYKKILVGDTAYYTSSLGEADFGVKVKGDTLIFEGGHFAMVNKAVKWYETVEVKDGKVATLTGTSEDFKSQVTMNGITYDYVWGDEFDGSEFNNAEMWSQSSFGDERSDDFVSIFNDPHFQYVENGRLRLTADRYYYEADGTKGYASSGDLNTDGIMNFRNGYIEFRARLPYRRGAFPAIWTMSNQINKNLPNYGYDDGFGDYAKKYWSIEFDLFESFADADHASTTLHKWYNDGGNSKESWTQTDDTPKELTNDQIKVLNERALEYGYHSWVTEQDKTKFMFGSPYAEGEDATAAADEYISKYMAYSENKDRYGFDSSILTQDITDADGTVIGKKYVYYPIYLKGAAEDGSDIDIFEYRLRPFTNMTNQGNTYAYSFTYPSTGSDNIVGNVKDGKYDWQWYFDASTVNQEYHVYSFHITSDHCTVSMDGVPYLDFDWDPAYDYRDVNGDGTVKDISNNNNGVGYNLWHYFLIDMMIYTPGNFKIDEARKLQKGDYPFNLYVDYVRVYQDLDDPSQALWYPNADAN